MGVARLVMMCYAITHGWLDRRGEGPRGQYTPQARPDLRQAADTRAGGNREGVDCLTCRDGPTSLRMYCVMLCGKGRSRDAWSGMNGYQTPGEGQAGRGVKTFEKMGKGNDGNNEELLSYCHMCSMCGGIGVPGGDDQAG